MFNYKLIPFLHFFEWKINFRSTSYWKQDEKFSNSSFSRLIYKSHMICNYFFLQIENLKCRLLIRLFSCNSQIFNKKQLFVRTSTYTLKYWNGKLNSFLKNYCSKFQKIIDENNNCNFPSSPATIFIDYYLKITVLHVYNHSHIIIIILIKILCHIDL